MFTGWMGWDVCYILFNHVPGIASNMIKIIGASRAYNIAWQAWNTGQSVFEGKYWDDGDDDLEG